MGRDRSSPVTGRTHNEEWPALALGAAGARPALGGLSLGASLDAVERRAPQADTVGYLGHRQSRGPAAVDGGGEVAIEHRGFGVELAQPLA